MTNVKQLPLRLPEQLKTWIWEQANLNGSSQNSEVIRAIRERMDRMAETQQKGTIR